MGKKIVILGAGFGGLHAAMVLGKKIGRRNEVILIDRNPYHTYTPTLYEIATTSKEVANLVDLKSIVTFPIAEILKGMPVGFTEAEIKELDLKGGDIHLDDGQKLKYDFLIIALGAETNYFNIPGLKENSLDLKSFNEAVKIRDTVWNLIDGGNKNVKILIGGGGSTGVELAGELQQWLCEFDKGHKKCFAEVKIIEAGPSILNGFPKTVVEKVMRRLARLAVEVITNEAIKEVAKKEVLLNSGKKIPFDVLIWAGGVKANSLTSGLPLKIERRGRAEVMPGMICLPESPELKLFGKIYGLGDVTCFYKNDGTPIPSVARAAISQADIVAKNIICDIYGKEPVKYKPTEYPYIIPVGGKYAVAKVGPIIISGFSAWILKGFVELNYLLSIMPPGRAVKTWLRGLKIFIQNDRLG
ncbi:MAG: NAD(P)/FAD-dependent oxidoreductase [Candidatus Colwellbacteria bacterium]|nr:NAD(P)/FAD-dependent oxidoreductase [Candidatus Colwellbacteria bacterium]